MINRKKPGLRFVCLLLIGTFCSQEVSYSAPPYGGIGTPLESILQDPTRFEAPVDFSTLKEIHRGEAGKPLIIHIQDAHSNFSGQENLAKTLDEIMAKYEVNLILVEGGAREGTLTPLREIIPRAALKQTARKLLLEGQVSGEEYLNLISDHPMKIMGIEDINLYARSLKGYASLTEIREEAILYLNTIQRSVEKLKKRFYPEELLNYEKVKETRSNEPTNFEENFTQLLSLAKNKEIELDIFPNLIKLVELQIKEKLIDFNLAYLEQASLIEEIEKEGGGQDLKNHLERFNRLKNQKASQFSYFQKVLNIAQEKNINIKQYPNLLKYERYLKEFTEIDLEQVLSETEKLEDQVYVTCLASKDALLIRAIDRYLRLLFTAYKIQMTTKDFKMFEVNEPDFSTISYQAFINRKLVEQGFFEDVVAYKPILEEGKKALIDFYDSVDKRDTAFIQNSEKILKEENQPIAVMITGGYHTQHLKELFQQKGYSYVVLAPQVIQETNQQKYEKLLLSPLKPETKTVQIVQGEKKTPDKSLGALEKDLFFARKKDGVRKAAADLLMDMAMIRALAGQENPSGTAGQLQVLLTRMQVHRAELKEALKNADLIETTPTNIEPSRAPELSTEPVAGARMAVARASQEQSESYDDIVIQELAKQKGVSVDDLEADFERTVTMLEERIQHSGFIQPDSDIIAQKIQEIFDRLIKVYQTKTQEAPGGFHIVDANTVNAFVIRKRTDVYFYKGLYEALFDISKRMNVPLTEDMIAFIIAHELSHSLQHTSNQGLDIHDLNESVSPYLIQMIKNSEYDADMRALELMDKAGYSVFGAVDAMTFLEFITSSSQAENVLSSHPYVSLRKHRLSQIIFDQKTNVFTHVKAPRTPMVGAGRIKSQDVDFRHLMDKNEQDLLAMVKKAESTTALDELAGMLVIRKRMNALKTIVKEDQLKISFLRHVYIQAVLAAVVGPTGITVMPDTIDYSDMKGAAAIYDFGKEPSATGALRINSYEFEEKMSDMIDKIDESLSHYTTNDVVAARRVLQGLLSTVRSRAKRLNPNDFDGFLLPLEQVKDLLPIFTKGEKLRGISVNRQAKIVDQGLIDNAIDNPIRLISAFFYAHYLGQEPSVEFGIPTTEVRIKLQRRKNEVYSENPAYRDIQSADNRRNLQNIVLLHHALAKTRSSVFSDYLNGSFPGIDEYLKVSSDTAREFFVKYYNLLSTKYPKTIAVQLAAKRVHDYLGVNIESSWSVSSIMNSSDTPKRFVNEVSEVRGQTKSEYSGEPAGLADYVNSKVGMFIDSHALILFIKNAIQEYANRLPEKVIKEFEKTLNELRIKDHSYSAERNISGILTAIANIYSQEARRETAASAVFSGETKLDYYLKEDDISSFKSLLALPDWAVSDYLNRKGYGVNKLIENALEEGTSIDEIFTFMKTRLAYGDRRKVFENLFLGWGSKDTYLINFFKSAFNNNPQEIIVWFLGMFSKKDALELIDIFSRELLYKKAKDTNTDANEAVELKNLTVALLEYIYSQTSKTFHADDASVKIYLDLINGRIEKSGARMATAQETVFNTLMVLSASTDLEIKLSGPDEISRDAAPDFKSKQTSILPQFRGNYGTYESKFSLHNFGWNDREASSQSIFVTSLTDLSIEQLKKLLKQRLRYVESKATVEYRGEVFSLAGLDDFFANLITLVILKKMHDPNWATSKSAIDRLDDLIEVSVSYSKYEGKINIYPSVKLKINNDEINAIPYDAIKNDLVGVAIPSRTLDPVWESYIEKNNLQGNFPEVVPLLQNPNVGNESINNPISFLERHKYGRRVPYRQIVKKFFMDSSVYSKLFNAYVKLHGKGYVYGKYKSLEERLAWIDTVLPNKSIIKDGIIDLWETDIFPEIIADLPLLVQLARQASGEGEDLRDMWALLGEMDDDVGRLKRLNDQINLSPEKIHQLLDFYNTVIPLALSPQKISRYGATAYLLWKQLPENANLGLSENLEALTRFMPEPSVLRDELLMKLANQYAKRLEDAPLVTEKLYSNNLLSRSKDLRTEDFVSETLLHLFGGAKTEDRRDVLLWMVGAQNKPRFVSDIEEKYNIDFTTLPADIKLLPATIREKFIEGFMLGDNGVLDPQNDSDRYVMSDFLERLFLYIFPEGTKGIGNEGRVLISKIFLIVMKSFPPYRRVQVIKALAALRTRSDFEKTSTGERLVVLLGVLGPVGIKVAQYLSENETLVPDDKMRSSLGALRHRAPEITKISAFSVLENEVPLSEVLVREMGEAVGVASIKQVNRGKWLDIELLAELVERKASRTDADEIREKMRAYQAREITMSEAVSYIVGKANQYNVDLENATVPVVFKIRRPNMETTLATDFAALDAVALELEGTSHNGETINISDLVQTVKEWVILEMNFSNEVKFANMLTELDYTWAKDFEKQAGVTIAHPKVLFVTDSLIVEEEVQGVPVLSLASKQQPITMEDVIDAGYARSEAERVFIRLSEVDPRQAHITLSLKRAGFSERSLDGLVKKMLAYDYGKLRELLRQMLLHQIFVDGVFHADLHQGNVLVTPDGRLVMIDRGNVGTLNKEQIEGAKILLKGLSLREKELIKQGVDRIFLNAQYSADVQPTGSTITVDDIQQVLDKGYDLKMTMSMISVRAVQGAKNTPGGKDFSTFLKAFTQAMYLFPTDLTNGMGTLQAIARYISMSEEDARRAAQEQAKYFVVKDVDTDAGEDEAQARDIMQITKRLFYKKTEHSFLHSIWQPTIFRMMAVPIKMATSRASSMKGNIMKLVRVHGRQIIEENIAEFVKRQDSEIGDVARDMLSVPYAEKLLTAYVERGMKERFLGKISALVITPLLRGILFLVRPFTTIYVEAAKEWIDTTGKQYIASIAPQMTVREGIDLLSQVFVEDFADIKKKFDEGQAGARLATQTSPRHSQTGFQGDNFKTPVVKNSAQTPVLRLGAEDAPRIQGLYKVEGLLPSQPIRSTKGIDLLLMDSLPLIVATQPQGALLHIGVSPVGVVPATFVGISIVQRTSGLITVELGQERDQVQITRENIQQAGSRLTTATTVQNLPKVYELKNEPQEIAVEAYQEQDKRTAQLFRQMVNRLTENKFAVFRFTVDDEEQQIVDNIAKEMAEFKVELDRLNQDAAFVFKARFELAGKNGNIIQQLETVQVITQEELGSAPQFHSSVENQAFLDEAKAVKAGYLPTEGIHVGEEVRVFNYKAIGRTGLAVVTDSPSAPQMIEALTGADMGKTDVARINLQLVKSPHTIPDVSIQTYRNQNLIIRALANLAQQLYQAYVTLRAAGASA